MCCAPRTCWVAGAAAAICSAGTLGKQAGPSWAALVRSATLFIVSFPRSAEVRARPEEGSRPPDEQLRRSGEPCLPAVRRGPLQALLAATGSPRGPLRRRHRRDRAASRPQPTGTRQPLPRPGLRMAVPEHQRTPPLVFDVHLWQSRKDEAAAPASPAILRLSVFGADGFDGGGALLGWSNEAAHRAKR